MMHAKNPAAGGAAGLSESVCLLADDQEVHQTQAPNQAQNQRIARNRLRRRRQRLVEHLHSLGPAPIGHFLAEIEGGASIPEHLEAYARLDPGFVRALGGDKFPPPFLHVICGGEP